MSQFPDTALPPDADGSAIADQDKPKQRRCLRCRSTFESSWSGERICPHCKTTAAWRRGAPIQSHTPLNRNR